MAIERSIERCCLLPSSRPRVVSVLLVSACAWSCAYLGWAVALVSAAVRVWYHRSRCWDPCSTTCHKPHSLYPTIAAITTITRHTMSKQKTGTDALLHWCQTNTANYRGVRVRDFDSSWADGLAFCALLHKFRPELIGSFDELSAANRAANLQLAFSKAESIGIPSLIDPEDILIPAKPDKFSIITYLTQYYHAFSDSARRSIQLSSSSSSSTNSSNASPATPPKLAFNSAASLRDSNVSTTSSLSSSSSSSSSAAPRGVVASRLANLSNKPKARGSIVVGAGAHEDRPTCGKCQTPISGATIQAVGSVFHKVRQPTSIQSNECRFISCYHRIESNRIMKLMLLMLLMLMLLMMVGMLHMLPMQQGAACSMYEYQGQAVLQAMWQCCLSIQVCDR